MVNEDVVDQITELQVEEIIEEQKKLAVKLLNCFGKLACIKQDVLVAGGAPRDWDRGLAAKDIDIFVGNAHRLVNGWFYQVKSLLEELFEEFKGVISIEDSIEDRKKYENVALLVVNVKGLNTPVQVIFCDGEVTGHIATFPVSISRIGFNYKGQTIKSLSYLVSEAFGTVYTRRPSEEENRFIVHPADEANPFIETNEEYINRVLSKYPKLIEQSYNKEYAEHMVLFNQNVKVDWTGKTDWRWL